MSSFETGHSSVPTAVNSAPHHPPSFCLPLTTRHAQLPPLLPPQAPGKCAVKAVKMSKVTYPGSTLSSSIVCLASLCIPTHHTSADHTLSPIKSYNAAANRKPRTPRPRAQADPPRSSLCFASCRIRAAIRRRMDDNRDGRERELDGIGW